jgi:2Fe-2S ferredoxin
VTVEIAFEQSTFGEALRCEAEAGQALIDLCDEHHAPVPFSCRSASCGTCLVTIDDPAQVLEPPGDDERAFLESLALIAPHRLTCQARIKSHLAGVFANEETKTRLRITVADHDEGDATAGS